jgi:membrane protein required for colicin V production
MNYTWIDYIIIAIFFVNIALGLMRGFLKEVVSIMAMILAFFIAIEFTQPLANFLSTAQGALDVISVISNFFGINVQGQLVAFTFGLSFLVIFVGVLSFGEAVIYYGPMDIVTNPITFLFRLLGGVLGFIRGYALCIIFILIMQLSPEISQNNAWTQSNFVPQLQPNAIWLGSLIGFPNP